MQADLKEETTPLQLEAINEKQHRMDVEEKLQITCIERDTLQAAADKGRRRIHDLEMQLEMLRNAADNAEVFMCIAMQLVTERDRKYIMA